jgi:CHAD domain-containing protein
VGGARQFLVTGSQQDVVAALGDGLGLAPEPPRRRSTTYLDTFDWRLHRAGLLLTWSERMLTLSALDGSILSIRVAVDAKPVFAGDLPPAVRERCAAIIEMRAVLEIVTVSVDEQGFRALNDDDKTVAFAAVLRHRARADGRNAALPTRVDVVGLRGYDRDAVRLAKRLAAYPCVEPVSTSLMDDALSAFGRAPGDYTGKFAVDLMREMPSWEAVGAIHGELLAAVRTNEAGTIADIDSEFLHDFRVAVRRARSALKELPGIFAPAMEERLRRELKWLGDVTTPVRDLDVYLLDFEDFRIAAGASGDDLEPLRAMLVREQRKSQATLAKTLVGARYRRLLATWERALTLPPSAAQATASMPIGELADRRLRKVSRAALRHGDAITADSPAEALHDLRKRFKELRYLLEFFASLYDPRTVTALVKDMKGLQDNLGEFQDTEVQQRAVHGYADRLIVEGATPAATIMALGRLTGSLEERSQGARSKFASRFGAFASPANRRRFAELTGQSR